MKTKTYYILLSIALILSSIETAGACSLNPTAVMTTEPDGTVFYNGDPVLLSGENSTANCGSINQYRWRVRPVGGSYTTIYQGSSPTYNYTFPLLQDGESEKSYDIELRVRNSSGLFGYAYKSVTVKHNHDSYYYLTDHLGSVRVTVDERGDPVGWDDYYPFGLQMPGRSQQQYGSPATDVKYTGYELNQEGGLGLYHAGARLYDPVVGRFMQQDPHTFNYPGWSPFVYVANNPLIMIDPDGRDWYDINGTIIWFDHEGDLEINYNGEMQTFQSLGADVLVVHGGEVNENGLVEEGINEAVFELYLSSKTDGPTATMFGNTIPADQSKYATIAAGLYSTNRMNYGRNPALLLNNAGWVPTVGINPNPESNYYGQIGADQILLHAGNAFRESLTTLGGRPISAGCLTGCSGNLPAYLDFMKNIPTNWSGNLYLRR